MMEVVHERVRLEVDVLNKSFRGAAELTVSSGPGRARFHCRQVEVKRVEVDGVATSWALADPLVVRKANVRRHDVDGLETWLRASMCACAAGELAVSLPAKDDEKHYRVAIEYESRSPEAGLVFFGRGSARTSHRVLGSALASADFDGARCWMPCVDAEPARHAWRLDVGCVGSDVDIVASGARVVVEVDDFFHPKARRASFVVESRAPARAIGVVFLADHDRVARFVDEPARKIARLESSSSLGRGLSRFDSSSSLPRRLARGDSTASLGGGGRRRVLECYFERGASARDAVEIAAKLADAAQFWRSWVTTADGQRGAKNRRGGPLEVPPPPPWEDEDEHHAVVLIEHLEAAFQPCVGLTMIDARLASLATGRHDSRIRGAHETTLATALASSLVLEDLAVRDPDADEWVLHAIVGAVVSRFVDRKLDGLRERLATLSRSAVDADAAPTRRPLSLVAPDEPPAWWRALEAGGGGALRAKAALVAHALEARLGRSTVRRAVCRLRDLALRDSSISPTGDSESRDEDEDDRQRGGCRRFVLSTSRFLRACALEPLVTMRTGSPDDLEAPDDQLPLTPDESVAEFRARWIEGAGCSILDCDYVFDAGPKQMLELNVEQRADDPRSFPEPARLPICVRVVEREDSRDYDKFLDTYFHKWEFKSLVAAAAVLADKPKENNGRATTPPPAEAPAPAPDEPPPLTDDASVEELTAAARAANSTPVLYVRLDPDLKLARKVSVKQPVHAWIHQLFGGDDDFVAQLDALEALAIDDDDEDDGKSLNTMADRMLAARALACALRSPTLTVAVRCRAAEALAEWQRRECAASSAFSRFAAGQLWRAFDERFKDARGLARPAAFRTLAADKPGDDDQLALKTALAAAFGTLSTKRDGRAWPEAADRCLELLRDHVAPDDDNNAETYLSNENYVATALASLASIAPKADAAWLSEAIAQARRYLDWHLLTDRQDAVAAAALAALHDLLVERERRRPPPRPKTTPEPERGEEDEEEEGRVEAPGLVVGVADEDENSSAHLVRTYANARMPELVRAVALKLSLQHHNSAAAEGDDDLASLAAAECGLVRREIRDAFIARGVATLDQLWPALVSAHPAIVYDQAWRVRLVGLYRTVATRANRPAPDAHLPEAFANLLSQVKSDQTKRAAPKRPRPFRDIDVTNPEVVKKIKFNFSAPPATPLAQLANHHAHVPTPALAPATVSVDQHHHQPTAPGPPPSSELLASPSDASWPPPQPQPPAIRPVAIKPIVLPPMPKSPPGSQTF